MATTISKQHILQTTIKKAIQISMKDTETKTLHNFESIGTPQCTVTNAPNI